MKHFVVEITYLVPFELLDDLRPAHRSFLQIGYDKGWLLMSGPLVPHMRALVVARAPEMADLQAFFADDPYQIAGKASYRFSEYEPVQRQGFLEDWVTGK